MKKNLLEKARLLAQESVDDRIRAKDTLINDLRKQVRSKADQIDQLNRTIDLICLFKDEIKKPRKAIVPKSKSTEVVPMIIWSDWHIEESVERNKTLGLNEYNLQIAEQRAAKCAESTVKLIRATRANSSVRSISLLLGGDFISGDIHQELSETNLLGPAEACIFAKQLLANGLATIEAEKYLERIHISCVVGNHGRTTKKMQFKNGTEKSFESIVYAQLASQFNDKRFEWNICRGGINVTPITKDFLVRDCHGHQFRYQGGIGGLTIPLTKWVHRLDQSQPCNFNRICHYHQYGTPAPRCLINGSLKGYDEYAAEHGFGYEPPLQAFAILDCARNRIGGTFPIYCE
jgi:hypothetical protein